MHTSWHRASSPRLSVAERALTRRRRIVVAILLACMGGFAVHTTSADDLSDKQNQRAQVGAQMNQIKALIAAAKDQEGKLQSIITQLDAEVASTEQSINAAEVKVTAIQSALSIAQDHLIAVQAKLTTDKSELATEMVTIYEMANSSTTISTVLSAGNISEFVDRLQAAQRVASAEKKLTDQVTSEAADVQTTVRSIAAQKADEQAVLAQLRSDSSVLQDQLGVEEQARVYLAQIQAQDEQRLKDAEAAAAQLDQEIAQIQAEQAAAAAAGGGSGRFSWPLLGPITQNFGCTSYPFEPFDANCPSRHFHSGIDIAPGCGTPVHAADAGIINTYFSSTGYGNHIIIVHGNGWSTLYGHMASFVVANGAQVARGQVIGYEGSTGNSTGCHLHFEVRTGVTPVNPMQYLP